MSDERDRIMATLAPLFKQAERDGLLFYHGGLSGPLYFTVNELRDQHARGKFVWGAPNWELVPPTRRIREAAADVIAACDRLDTAIAQAERAARERKP